MKRFTITLKDNISMNLFYKNIMTAKQHWNEAIDIQENTDYSYLKYIDLIKDKSIEIKPDHKGRTIYKIPISNGYALIRFGFDEIYLDFLEFQVWRNNRFTNPISWQFEDVEIFYNDYININPLKVKLYSVREYGQPKLSKPKELKGIKQSFNVNWLGNKVKCQCFFKDNDLYIKHRDFFSKSMKKSPELFGTSLEHRIKVLGINSKRSSGFIYDDCWGDIVLRNEAWIKIENIIPQLNKQNPYELTMNTFESFCECLNDYGNTVTYADLNSIDCEWNNFWENTVKELIKFSNQKVYIYCH